MSRSARPYGERIAPTARSTGFDADTPVAGFYRMRLRSGGVFAAIRIWYGPPCDPVTGDELDRGWRWQATANGEPIDIQRVWPVAARSPMGAQEYALILSKADWAREHAPDSAMADPTRRADPLSTPLLF